MIAFSIPGRWSRSRLVRAGQWHAIDRANVAEEIASLAQNQFCMLEGAVRVLFVHALKWDHQPAMRSRTWSLSIQAQRIELGYIIEDNPGLKPRISEAIARAYRKARLEAARETGLDEARFPEQCPYGWDDMVLREFAA